MGDQGGHIHWIRWRPCSTFSRLSDRISSGLAVPRQQTDVKTSRPIFLVRTSSFPELSQGCGQFGLCLLHWWIYLCISAQLRGHSLLSKRRSEDRGRAEGLGLGLGLWPRSEVQGLDLGACIPGMGHKTQRLGAGGQGLGLAVDRSGCGLASLHEAEVSQANNFFTRVCSSKLESGLRIGPWSRQS